MFVHVVFVADAALDAASLTYIAGRLQQADRQVPALGSFRRHGRHAGHNHWRRRSGGPARCWWAGYQMFLQFALTYLDRLWHMHFKKAVTWDIPHRERFDAIRALPTGVIIFTIHSGNYDIGASLFAEKFGRKLHTVRAPEQRADMQKLREAELRRTEQANPLLKVHYSEADNHLGMELCRILRTGEAVAVQGDRVIGKVSPVVGLNMLTVKIDDRTYALSPKTGEWTTPDLNQTPAGVSSVEHAEFTDAEQKLRLALDSTEARRVLDAFGKPHTDKTTTGPTQIFNLGHGISQFTPPESVGVLVETVHSHSRALRKP